MQGGRDKIIDKQLQATSSSPDVFRSNSAPKGKARLQAQLPSQRVSQQSQLPAQAQVVPSLFAPVRPLMVNESKKSAARALQTETRVAGGMQPKVAEVRRSPTVGLQSMPTAAGAASTGGWRQAGSSSSAWDAGRQVTSDGGAWSNAEVKNQVIGSLRARFVVVCCFLKAPSIL